MEREGTAINYSSTGPVRGPVHSIKMGSRWLAEYSWLTCVTNMLRACLTHTHPVPYISHFPTRKHCEVNSLCWRGEEKEGRRGRG